ncbi:MAG: PD40 domain-containing protein [Anaerolineae bacterium]|nr:PD40 domain-containing protein [Anaerolineae bacterium]
MLLKPKHVTQYLEAYLDHQLSPEERQLVDEHLAVCPGCAQRFFDARRVSHELGPVLKTVLGRPAPPPALSRQIRHALARANTPRRFAFPWAASGRALNAVGTLAIVSLLAFGVFGVIQGQMVGPDVASELQSGRPGSGGEIATATPTATTLMLPAVEATPILKQSSLGDTLPKPSPSSADSILPRMSTTPPLSSLTRQPEEENLLLDTADTLSPAEVPELNPPAGTIAFSFFNNAPGRQFYEIHLIKPDGSNHRFFPLEGVSEPALVENGQQIAYRAWSEPTSPRSLLSSNLEGYTPQRVGGFWEDAQPDWSPTENRLIFASQREMDRRWRLYTSWGDGSVEINLRREGKSPTFAPDGYRFAFESCDTFSTERCGLWLGDLDNSEYDSYPFLEDPLAKSPDWSPVSEQIAYMANPDDNWDLYLVNSDGRQARRLTTGPAIDGLPTWSPDGEWLAFLSNRGGVWGIWLLHVNSGQVHQVVSLPEAIFIPAERPPYGLRNWWDEQLSWSR